MLILAESKIDRVDNVADLPERDGNALDESEQFDARNLFPKFFILGKTSLAGPT